MDGWAKERGNDIIYKIVLFIISPFISFLYSLRSINSKSSYIIFFLTAVFFGMALTVGSGKGIDQNTIDGYFYRAEFENYQYVSFQLFMENLENFFLVNGEDKDFYFDTVAFLVSRFTTNYHYLFMFCAIVFSYFSLKSLRFLTSEERFDASLISYILVYLFLFNQIFNINGLRFPTAAWIAVYCIFQIYKNGNNKFYLLALLTPFFHGTFWIFIAVLFLLRFSRQYDKLWILLFVLSFIFSGLSVELAKVIQPYLPIALSDTVDSYTDEESINALTTGYGWVPGFFHKVMLSYVYIILFLFIKNGSAIKNDKKTRDLYLALLVWMAIFNFLMFIPHLGLRFMPIMYPVIAYIWLVHFKGKKYSMFIMLLPIAFIWQILEKLFLYSEVLSYDFFVYNPIYLIYKYLVVG